MKDMYGIRADELDMHSIIAESIIGFLLQHTGIMIQRQDISMNSSVCAAAVPLLPRFGISPESLLNECEKTECGLPYSNMRKYRGINIFEQVSAKNGYLCFDPTIDFLNSFCVRCTELLPMPEMPQKIVFPCSTEYACARLLTYYCSGCRCIMTDSVRTALFRSFALAGGFETKRLYERAVHSAERAVLAAFGNSDGGKFGGVQASAAAILLSSAKMTLVQ
jgi:hypothetical protein